MSKVTVVLEEYELAVLARWHVNPARQRELPERDSFYGHICRAVELLDKMPSKAFASDPED